MKYGIPNIAYSSINPLIDDDRIETLEYVRCAVAFISRWHKDRADWMQEADEIKIGPSIVTQDEIRGLAALLDCIGAAVNFEQNWRAGV